MSDRESLISSHEQLLMAIQSESRKFQEYYVWLEKAMPPLFFEEVSQENMMLIAHSLMGFPLQEYYSTIHLKRAAIVLCLDSPDADLNVLKDYALYGIKNYQAYVSKIPPPFPGITAPLRIVTIYFTEAIETLDAPFPKETKEQLRALAKERNPSLNHEEFERLISGINTRFLRSQPIDLLILALDLYFKALTRDNCQYEVRYNEDWDQTGSASMHVVIAWRNAPKHNFLYQLARMIHRHGLMMKRVNATYINPYSRQNVLIMVLGLHGSNGQAVWDVAEIPDFVRELSTIKFFSTFDEIDKQLVSKKVVNGNMGNLLRSMKSFVHQSLVHVDPNIYTLENVEEGLCRHPELTATLCEAFKLKFDPDFVDYDNYLSIRERFINDVQKLDTGQELNDLRRRNILLQGMNFIHHILKTNFYRLNYTALSFRLDPRFLDEIPFDREKKFPELPYAIFYMRGMHFFGFHIRFKDLARGGLRTVIPEQTEQLAHERNTVFTECYNLALTQHMKNKDIPEAGSKGIIFLRPFDRLVSESVILQGELEASKIPAKEIEAKIEKFRQEQHVEYLHQAQRSYIESLITIVNCDPDGKLRPKYIIDYWKKPEYLYLGPDENMHDEMITWIADYSKRYDYRPGSAFISGKPTFGINHKEYGVTSLGVNTYMELCLKYIGIDPSKDAFSVKLSGGPDGDVAGNEIYNLYRLYPQTAKIKALTDVSGTIYDPEGLDLPSLANLFKQAKAIKYYPPEKLHEGGFLLDKNAKKHVSAFVQHTLCWRKTKGKVTEDWITGSDMNALLRNNVHQVVTDVFIPSGGRPRTLNEGNIKEFLDPDGKPTSKVIVEGANLYITPKAREKLEKLGVLLIKDSSANKTGVICSSFEVLCGLALGDDIFLAHRAKLVQEILERLKTCATLEAELLLNTHKQTGDEISLISDLISNRINLFTYQILDHLDTITLSNDPNDPLLKCFLDYCLPTLRKEFREALIQQIPDHHKKAIIASHIASQQVYHKGLSWLPSIVDILPILLEPRH